MRTVLLTLAGEGVHWACSGVEGAGSQNSYTMEASFCGADFGRRAERHFTVVQLEEMGRYFYDTILDYCDPDQSKVHSTLRELQALNPSNHSAHSGCSSNNNAEGGDSGGSGEEEPTVKTKVKSRQRRGSKKTSSSVSNGQAKSSEGGGKGIVGGNNGKKKRMRRRASLPAVGDGRAKKAQVVTQRQTARAKIARPPHLARKMLS